MRIMGLGSSLGNYRRFPGGLGRAGMAGPERRYGPGGGIRLGGIFVWSLWIGLLTPFRSTSRSHLLGSPESSI
jgi:hypothetical protein